MPNFHGLNINFRWTNKCPGGTVNILVAENVSPGTLVCLWVSGDIEIVSWQLTLTFEKLSMHGQQHSFSTDDLIIWFINFTNTGMFLPRNLLLEYMIEFATMKLLSNLYSQLGYPTGVFIALQLVAFVVFDDVYQPVPSVILIHSLRT